MDRIRDCRRLCISAKRFLRRVAALKRQRVILDTSIVFFDFQTEFYPLLQRLKQAKRELKALYRENKVFKLQEMQVECEIQLTESFSLRHAKLESVRDFIASHLQQLEERVEAVALEISEITQTAGRLLGELGQEFQLPRNTKPAVEIV